MVEPRDWARFEAIVSASPATFELTGVFVRVLGVACPHALVAQEQGRLLWFELVGVAEEIEFMAVPAEEHMEVVDWLFLLYCRRVADVNRRCWFSLLAPACLLASCSWCCC